MSYLMSMKVAVYLVLLLPMVGVMAVFTAWTFISFMSWTEGRSYGIVLRVILLWALFILAIRFI